MPNPLRDFYDQLGQEPIRPEFEARLEKVMRDAAGDPTPCPLPNRSWRGGSMGWGWVIAPALAAYLMVALMAQLPASSAPQASNVGREPLMGRLTASR